MWKRKKVEINYSCLVAESTTVSISDTEKFKQNALHWANYFRVACLLDSNNYPPEKYKSKEWILAVDAIDETSANLDKSKNYFDALKNFCQEHNSYIFGFFTYDLKNEIENLESKNFDGLKFPPLYFFKPRYLFEINGNKLTVNRNYPETFELINIISKFKPVDVNNKAIHLRARTCKEKYLQNVESIRSQIKSGDFYEINYCNEFYATNAAINPTEVFLKLNEKAKAPFSCFFKLDNKFLLCASPERFLKKEGDKLISQPIKGTMRKGNTLQENELLKQQLKNDTKERAENIMIVDLVRNDLARSSKAGTVNVEELCEVYEFNTVNQMISTVVSECDVAVDETTVIKNAFPMGSMTGAPKIEVMKNIERYEEFKRGLYSGSVGYFTAEGNFDFNVVIRSVFYNADEQYLSTRTGGAITYDSGAEKEWEELLLKVQGLLHALNAEIKPD